MCTLILKETLAYCTVDGRSAFCTFLDARTDFDRINYLNYFFRDNISASEMTYIVSSGALNSTHSLTRDKVGPTFFLHMLT